MFMVFAYFIKKLLFKIQGKLEMFFESFHDVSIIRISELQLA